MASFPGRILAWYDRHGRKDLPWQQNPTPYRVWVSEIMLQQTQVTTVIPYYERFMQRFPDVRALADAAEDDVLHHWSGLGYYARARNLQKAARIIRDEYAGEFPAEFEAVASLPGIGRSTAGAILSLALNQRHAILDGNVKRVLSRHAGIEGWPGTSSVEKALWSCAEERTPSRRVANYNQAMMDLGATLCTRTRPACAICPVAGDCVARIENRQHELPGRKPRKETPLRRTEMLLLELNGAVLLEKRPPAGIWGGLWSFPECDDHREWLREQGIEALEVTALPEVTHVFSHFRLDIRPLRVVLRKPPALSNDRETVWYHAGREEALGFAAPVKSILEQHFSDPMNGERDGTHG